MTWLSSLCFSITNNNNNISQETFKFKCAKIWTKWRVLQQKPVKILMRRQKKGKKNEWGIRKEKNEKEEKGLLNV